MSPVKQLILDKSELLKQEWMQLDVIDKFLNCDPIRDHNDLYRVIDYEYGMNFQKEQIEILYRISLIEMNPYLEYDW